MDEYGYMYNKFTKDVKKFASTPNLRIKSNENAMYTIYIVIICILLFIAVYRYT